MLLSLDKTIIENNHKYLFLRLTTMLLALPSHPIYSHQYYVQLQQNPGEKVHSSKAIYNVPFGLSNS